MQTVSKFLLTANGVAALALLTSPGRAQSHDIDPPAPNVLFLIDTSGSMERTVDGKEPTCTPLTTPSDEAKSRWAVLVESLTGPIQNFSCLAQSRGASAFINEYTLGITPPYDANYYIPFHRLLSSGCTKGPGANDDALKEHDYTGSTINCSTAWSQSDGLLDTYRDRIRFSLMTFDTFTDAGTGWATSSPNYPTGVAGTWSYFLGWASGGAPAQGNPPGCAAQDTEVGARNPAAPLWEGPLVPFPSYDAPISEVQATNDRIQNALIAMRPYGATPLAGMLTDARDFLLNDESTWKGKPLGPKDDPYIDAGCRSTSIILISDGEPNLDLRPECAAATGPGVGGTGCPYEEPYIVAGELADNPNPVRTFTIGFGLDKQVMAETGNDDVCKTIAESDFVAPGKCASPTGALKACCTLARIAIEGGTEHGYFPDDAGELSTMMSQILAEASHSTSRTLPVFASATVAASGDADAIAYQFAASFDPSSSGALWKGNLERKRYVCTTENGPLEAELQDVDKDKGDDFALNLSQDATTARRIFTVVGNLDSSGKIRSERSIRPGMASTNDDGLGLYSGTTTTLLAPEGFAGEMRNAPLALDLDPTQSPPKPLCSTGLHTNTAADCAESITKWELGFKLGQDISNREGSELGSIYHSTPAVMGPPHEPVTDASYELFAQQQENRPIVLYTATTDGQLHAFQVARGDTNDPMKVDKLENNELWSFLPPHVLPNLLSSFNQQAFLLDGVPVVQNIIFERTLDQAKAAGTVDGSQWHTVLLAGGGQGGGFYYALDVTNPKTPQFLWQISKDASGNALFGIETPTPAMGMVELEVNGTIKEVAVAFLPGGSTNLNQGLSCNRKSTSAPLFSPTGNLKLRTAVRCWGDADGTGTPVGPARSLTVVRLDTGEVLRTFRGDAHIPETPASLVARTTVVNFDSPVTGIPVPYPAAPGQVADRVYIGDAEGTLWRLNLIKPKPEDWTVDLAWDAYSFSTDTSAMGQPIETPPVVSLDPLGNKVILFSTGDQETFTTGGGEMRVWSITEEPYQGSFRVSENWVIPLSNGVRATGPISLFNEVAYFSTFTPTPPGAYQCADGFGSIWGVDYLRTGTPPSGYTTPDNIAFPQARLDPDNDPGTPLVHYRDETPGTMVFGLAVAQTPTCVTTDTYSDPVLGIQPKITNSSTPKFQLIYQAPKTNGTNTQDTAVPIKSMDLKSPRPVVRIDSWANIVE